VGQSIPGALDPGRGWEIREMADRAAVSVLLRTREVNGADGAPGGAATAAIVHRWGE